MNRNLFELMFKVPRLSWLCLLGAGCATSVNDYLVEARRGDPESIHQAVIQVAQLLDEKEERGIPFDAGDEEAMKYLTEVADTGQDAVNRASAVDGLSRLTRPGLTELYLRRLEDRSWSVQLEAAKALARNPAPEAVEPLVRRLEAEVRNEVRLEILKALAATGGERALKVLLDAFLERSARYANMKLTIHDGLKRLSGQAFRVDEVESWRSFQLERFPPLKPADPAPEPRDKEN